MPLKAVTDNPFRILGVFSNAKPAEIVSNCDDMEAYLNIGQEVLFDLDFNNLMQKVNRTSQTVELSKRKINLPKDKLKYALFWFLRDSSSTHVVNYLKNGDFDNVYEVLDIEDPLSSMLNKSVTGILQDNDLGFAIQNITKIIHDDGYRNELVKVICGDAFTIDEEELAHLYIDTLLEEVSASTLMKLFQENGVSESDDTYLKGKAVDEPILRINAEIAKAKSVARDDADASYRAGKALMENTKADLAKVKNLLGTSNMKYQMLADELAKTIQQCGINYFNNTDDDDDIEKALTIQKYACKIAVGKVCKDRCNHNVAILEKKKEEQTIGSDLLFIANALRSFQNKIASINNARNLVYDCFPHLNNIKNQLGSSNDLYLNTSSAVANNALGMLVTVINNAQQSFSIGSMTKSGLKDRINDTISVMNLIGNLDMISTQRFHFSRNQSSLYDIKSRLDMAEGGGDGCYIATMCYGDYNHPQVMVLRDFRDTVLLQHSWGQSFVRFYYRHSPNWVEHLKDKYLINKIIRKILDNFIIMYKYVKK